MLALPLQGDLPFLSPSHISFCLDLGDKSMVVYSTRKQGLNIEMGPGVTVQSESLRATRPGNVYKACTLDCHDMTFPITNPQIHT